MAPTARTPESLLEYSQRERKAIVLLTLAFIVLSALVHFGLGALYRPLPQVVDKPQPRETLIIGGLETPTPAPTFPPTPTPKPVFRPAQPHQQPQVRTSPDVSTRPPIVGPSMGPGPGETSGPGPGPSTGPGPGNQTVVQTEPPEPVFAPCRMLRKIQPDYPEGVKSAGIQGTTIVVVAIGPDGQVVSARVGESSGNSTLDNAAVAAARVSTYACPPTASHQTDLYQVIYVFSLDS
jgi:periplasmic protein TonB